MIDNVFEKQYHWVRNTGGGFSSSERESAAENKKLRDSLVGETRGPRS